MKKLKELIKEERDCVPVDFNALPDDLAETECFCLICERIKAMGAEIAFICNSCFKKTGKHSD